MTRTPLVIGGTTVAALSAAGVLLAGPALGGSAATTHTLHLKVHTLKETEFSKHQFSEADQLTSHGKKVGNDVLYGRIAGHTETGHVTAALKGGTMRLTFTFDFTQGNSFAGKVTGGTGKYAGASGTITGTGTTKGADVTIKYTTS